MTTSALFSFLILFILNTTPSPAYSLPVKDTKGTPLKPNVPYLILPSARATIGLASAPNRTCPLDVVLQTDKTSQNGLPVIFSSVKPGDKVINTEVDLNVEFSASTICVISTVWRIESSTNETTTQYFVSIGGVKGNPGQETLSNWFRIESYEGGYVLVFCPSVCEICRPVCGNIGVILENGRRRLGITFDNQPLKVSFILDRQHS